MGCVKNEKGEYECCSDPVSICEFYSSDCWLPKSQCWNLGARRQADDKATIAKQKATIERLRCCLGCVRWTADAVMNAPIDGDGVTDGLASIIDAVDVALGAKS